MSDRDWERLGELIEKVVHLGGTWQEKRQILKSKLEEYNYMDDLEEIVSWFEEEAS